VLRNKVADIGRTLDNPVFFDQHPGKNVPYLFSKTYRFDPVAPSAADISGFLLPTNGNVLTGRDGSFYWCETNAFLFIQSNRTPVPNAGLFSTDQAGGGAIGLQDMQGRFAPVTSSGFSPFVGWEVDLYDKKRGRSITNGFMPGQTFFAGSTGYRRWNQPVRWDPDTEIEPRVRISVAERSVAPVTATNVIFFLNIVFKGFTALSEVTGRETLLAGEDEGRR